jgi:molybdopterin molybdotransferase
MKSVREAESETLAAFTPVGVERCALLAAQGRYLAEPLSARYDAPPFDNSAMDGYALIAADAERALQDASVSLRLTGESRAGDGPTGPVLQGETYRIFTGAPIPQGADCVEMQENVSSSAGRVVLTAQPKVGQHIRRRGSDFAAGACLLEAGARLDPAEIALLASQDHANVPVFRRPRVAIVATGDELREIGEPPRPGSIVNSNAYMLAAQVHEAGAEPWVLPVARDIREVVAESLQSALRADVVVLSGGVSVGDYDVVRDALADVGLTLDFWKVDMKPGKPLAFARHGRVPVLGLPGNPASSFLAFELFARPGLRAMLGDPRPHRARVPARLARDLRRKAGRTEFVRVTLDLSTSPWTASPLVQQGSGNLRSIASAHGLLEVPGPIDHFEAGTPVEVRLLGGLPVPPRSDLV